MRGIGIKSGHLAISGLYSTREGWRRLDSLLHFPHFYYFLF
jgi:hypothetical protein